MKKFVLLTIAVAGLLAVEWVVKPRRTPRRSGFS